MALRPGLDQQRVVEAAVAVADRLGFERLSWALVAQELGVKPPSLYNHVGSYDRLKDLMALEGVRRLRDALAGSEELADQGRAYVRFARENPSLYAASIRAPTSEQAELIQVATAIVDHMTLPFLSRGVPRDLAIHAVRVFRSALHGFVSIEASGGFGLPQSLDKTLEALLVVLTGGLERLLFQEER